MSLSNSQLRYLRGLGHDLKPVVAIAVKGLTDNVMAEIELALDHHELIKVRISADDRDARDALIESILMRTLADKVQRVGHVLTLFRRNPREPKLELPR
ncbi:MAG: ribosome assembly RNA-binding protein YhbY [Lysobacterales bacterium]